MPSRAMYELKVTGLLSGPLTVNGPGRDAFQVLFPETPPNPLPSARAVNWQPPTGPWPQGFVLPGYEIIRWDSRAEEWPRERLGAEQTPGPERTTALTFHAQLTRTLLGALFDNRDTMLSAGFGQVLDVVHFRDWKWYCGNGGGS